MKNIRENSVSQIVIKPADIEAFTIILSRLCKKIHAVCAAILGRD
jgi:hypothetical protein